MRYEVVTVFMVGQWEKTVSKYFGSYEAAQDYAGYISNDSTVVFCQIYYE